jgi:hypothetical protein
MSTFARPARSVADQAGDTKEIAIAKTSERILPALLAQFFTAHRLRRIAIASLMK